MADQKKEVSVEKAVVFVTRGGLQYFGSSSKNVISYSFDTKMVKDLDVVDAAALTNQLKGLIDQNKLVPSPVLFIFSESACFYEDIKETDEIKIKSSLDEFVNTVPFETLLTKIYRGKDSTRIVSINEKLYREIASAFELSGFLSLGVIPSFVLGAKAGMAPSMDVSIAKQVLTNIESLREQSFLATAVEVDTGEEKPTGKPVVEKSFKITRNFVLLGVVFVVLIGILVFMLARQ